LLLGALQAGDIDQLLHCTPAAGTPCSRRWRSVAVAIGSRSYLARWAVAHPLLNPFRPWLSLACPLLSSATRTHARTHLTSLFSRTTRVSRYQKGKTNLDFTEARDIEWQWHQLGHMQVCILLQTDNHASIPPLKCLQAGCLSCRPANSVKALKAI